MAFKRAGPARPGPFPQDQTLTWARFDRFGLAQNHPDHQVTPPQNTDLDELSSTILSIRRETARKGKTIFGFHPTKLSVGTTISRAGIIIPHTLGGVSCNKQPYLPWV